MAQITYPYSIGAAVYGTALSSVYSWYVQWYQYPTNTSTMTPTSNFTINSVVMGSPNATVNVTIYDSTLIERSGSVGYAAGVFTYSTVPTIRLYNNTLGTYVAVYNTSLSTTVADNSGNYISGTILHSQTLNISVPATWFQSPNTTWNVQVSNLMTIVSTAVSQTNTRTSVNFYVPLSFNMTVRYADALRPVLNMWVRKDDALVTVQTITVKKT